MSRLVSRLPKSLTALRSKTIGDNAYSWNLILRGFLEGNVPNRAILAYVHMRRRGVNVDSFTLLFVIKACGLVVHGILGVKQVHAQVVKFGFQQGLVTQTALLQVYGLFGELEAADKLFDETPQRDLIQWNVLLSLYSQGNRPHNTIKAAHQMMRESVRPNEVSAVSIISACSQLKALEIGKQWHGYVIKQLPILDAFIHNALINMYATCRCLPDAETVFRNLGNRNEVTWTSIINAYSDNGYSNEALALFKEMEASGEEPDEVTVLGVVSICAKLGRSDLGEWIDEYVKNCGFHKNMCIANALIDMHSKCGSIEKSCRIFDMLTMRTLITWTSLIQGLAMHGYGRAALARFSQMQKDGFRPDEVSFLSMINACSHCGLVEEGKHFFRCMVEEYGMKPWMEHYGSMVDLLCRAGLVSEAFDLVVNMLLKPDMIIWRTLIGACRDQGNISLARQILDYVIELEPEDSGNYILKSNLHAVIGDWHNVQELRSSMRCKEVTKRQPAHSYAESTTL